LASRDRGQSEICCMTAPINHPSSGPIAGGGMAPD
jgi:hypothetical protein